MDKLFMVFGMTLVTYLPRLTPFILKSKKADNEDLEVFLKLIPYAALGALIIPGVFGAVDGHIGISIFSAVVAVLVAWRFNHLVLSVICAILASFYCLQFL